MKREIHEEFLVKQLQETASDDGSNKDDDDPEGTGRGSLFVDAEGDEVDDDMDPTEREIQKIAIDSHTYGKHYKKLKNAYWNLQQEV
jgi:hypothetical protein